ncbi:hypothetical protein H8R18_02885 [Nanchangia anserum]|nr:hypothetical protein H8R18_02885 [Nanchangia anserum]
MGSRGLWDGAGHRLHRTDRSVDQRERFTEQSLAAAAGDPEAMSLDDDFLRTLELGMPPLGGLGLGVDRLVMAATGANIRQILAFPSCVLTSRERRVNGVRVVGLGDVGQ